MRNVMDCLRIAAGVVPLMMSLTALFYALRARRKLMSRKEKKPTLKQLQEINRLRAGAVGSLNRELQDYLTSIPNHRRGVGVLHEAQHVAERIFYDWLNRHFNLFNFSAMAESKVRITGVKNGLLTYELPDQLNQYIGKRK